MQETVLHVLGRGREAGEGSHVPSIRSSQESKDVHTQEQGRLQCPGGTEMSPRTDLGEQS